MKKKQEIVIFREKKTRNWYFSWKKKKLIFFVKNVIISLLWTLQIYIVKGKKVKYPYYRPWRPTGDVDARVHILTATVVRRGWLASVTLGRFTPGEGPRSSFYRRLSGPQGQSRHIGVKKNLPLFDTRDQPGPSSLRKTPCCFSYMAHKTYITTLTNISRK